MVLLFIHSVSSTVHEEWCTQGWCEERSVSDIDSVMSETPLVDRFVVILHRLLHNNKELCILKWGFSVY